MNGIFNIAYNKTVDQTTANRVIQVFFVSDKGDSIQHVPVDYGETLQTQIEEKHTIYVLQRHNIVRNRAIA